MAHAEEKLPVVNSAFISRTFVGPTAGNILKGMLFGNAVALSQALGEFQHGNCHQIAMFHLPTPS